MKRHLFEIEPSINHFLTGSENFAGKCTMTKVACAVACCGYLYVTVAVDE